MPRKNEPKEVKTSNALDPNAFALAEYAALQDEALKNNDYQHQVISLTFIAAGTVFSLSTQAGTQAVLLLAYPILAMFLSLGWSASAIRIKRIKLYIKDHLETRVTGQGWETFLHANTHKIKRSMKTYYARGVFIGTQLIAVLLALPKLAFTSLEVLFLSADLVAIFTVIYLTRPNRPAFL